MISQDLLNEAYAPLEAKQNEILRALRPDGFRIRSGWYNGHYHRDESGEWVRSSYPIPEVDVMGLCDIEIHFDRICVTTKLKRDAALAYSFEEMMEYEFEAYGIEDYLSDYYHPGQTVQALKDNILTSTEAEIGFSFTFPSAPCERICVLVERLKKEGFYY